MSLIDTSLNEIAKKILESDNILLYPHVGIDGDALGSSAALISALRKLGKNCYALYEEKIPENLSFMTKDYFTGDMNIIPDGDLDLSIAVDCGELQRFSAFEEKFKASKFKICLDHHGTSIFEGENGPYGLGDMNFIEPEAAAAGEIVFRVLEAMNEISPVKILPSEEIGIAIFSALTTDTGNFQYSNTRGLTHEIMAKIYSWGVNTYPASCEIYENERINKLQVEALAIERTELSYGGAVATSFVSKEELERLGILEGETEPIIKKLRSIRGVSYAAFLKEKEKGVVRVSLRAKLIGDVSGLAKKYNGGGHKKAAGFTLNMNISDAYELTKNELINLAKEQCK